MLSKKQYQIFASLIIVAFLVSSIQTISQGQKISRDRLNSQTCLELVYFMDESNFIPDSPNSCLQALYPSTITIKSYTKILTEIGFRKFPTNLAFISDPSKPYGWLDNPTPEKVLLLKRSDRVNTAGWAILPDSRELPRIVLLSYGDNKSFFTSAYVNLDSPDVAKAMNSSRYSKVRWAVNFSPKYMPLGETVIKAWVYDPPGKQFVKLNGEMKVKIEEG